jgi:hypothetical protein
MAPTSTWRFFRCAKDLGLHEWVEVGSVGLAAVGTGGGFQGCDGKQPTCTTTRHPPLFSLKAAFMFKHDPSSGITYARLSTHLHSLWALVAPTAAHSLVLQRAAAQH